MAFSGKIPTGTSQDTTYKRMWKFREDYTALCDWANDINQPSMLKWSFGLGVVVVSVDNDKDDGSVGSPRPAENVPFMHLTLMCCRRRAHSSQA